MRSAVLWVAWTKLMSDCAHFLVDDGKSDAAFPPRAAAVAALNGGALFEKAISSMVLSMRSDNRSTF